jgi:hypothetical protein
MTTHRRFALARLPSAATGNHDAAPGAAVGNRPLNADGCCAAGIGKAWE